VSLALVSTIVGTDVFDGRARLRWPADTFAEGSTGDLPTASGAALRMYRRDHDRVARAYRAHAKR
jgi:hypothetical protein